MRQIYDDLWRYDMEHHRWTYVQDRTGVWPKARYAHSSVFVPSSAPGVFAGSLLVFGGRTMGGVLLNDFWAWNDAKETWRQVDDVCGFFVVLTVHEQFTSSIEHPPAACYSSLTLIDNGRICLYGGQTDKAPRGSKIMWICEEGIWCVESCIVCVVFRESFISFSFF
jgi:hypothetical protein